MLREHHEGILAGKDTKAERVLAITCRAGRGDDAAVVVEVETRGDAGVCRRDEGIRVIDRCLTALTDFEVCLASSQFVKKKARKTMGMVIFGRS